MRLTSLVFPVCLPVLAVLLLQVTRRWLNFEGVAVPCHLAQQLQLMEALVAPGDTPPQTPAAAAAVAASAANDGSSRVVSNVGGVQVRIPATTEAAVDSDVTNAAVV
jgi:hypothetical protein